MDLFKLIGKLAANIIAGAICLILGKFVFICLNLNIFNNIGVNNIWEIVKHGFSMDLSIAAYLSVIPGLLLWLSLFLSKPGIIKKILKGYFMAIAALLSLIILLDSVLYGYWQFKLDVTPFFYFFSSPKAAFASAEWWMVPIGLLSWGILATLYFIIYSSLVLKVVPPPSASFVKKKRVTGSVIFCVSFILIFITLRGGVTVSTMNLSRAYFSEDSRLNHAAINPVFSLMYSLSHQDNFADQYRFYAPEEAASLFKKLQTSTEEQFPEDSLKTILRQGSRPDIYVLIMESFSSHLFPSLGGEKIAMKLDSIASEGLLFTNYYANSFRTDRGIVAILSGYPGQPNTSIMKYASKTEGLPSFPNSLRKEGGYSTEYYYGGDANFTNMKAYLVNAGFEKIISDQDFPLSKRLSKWGAHDDILFAKVLERLTPYDAQHPRLRVIQTSSSHEPFEVNYDDNGRFSDKRAKAFAYSDSCAAVFIKALKNKSNWDHSLVIIVPDHFGGYPELDDPLARHKIPLIFTGGSLASKGICDTYGSQIDLSATLLSALGIKHDDFPFSHNLLNPTSPHFGVFADPSVIGMISQNDTTLFNLDSEKTLPGYGNRSLPEAKAFLQTLYDDFSQR